MSADPLTGGEAKLSPAAEAEAQRILDAWARRVLAEQQKAKAA